MLIAFEGIYRHYLYALFLASQNESVKLMIFREGLNVSSAAGSTALLTPAAGGKAPGKSALNH